MKIKLKYLSVITIALTMVLAFGSCKKDNDNENVTVAASMSARINSINELDTTKITSSKDWSAITRISLLKGDVLTITGTELSILTTPDIINVTIYGTEVGTYKLGINDLAAQCGSVLSTKYNDANVTFTSTSGTVVLTKVDKTAQLISGTYEFWLFSGGVWKTITNGKFENLKYDIK